MNDICNTFRPNVIRTDMLSDHFPIFRTISKANCVITNPNKITYKPLMYRDYTNFTSESFKNELNNNLYDFMDNKLSCPEFSNLNKLFDEFVSNKKQTIDSHVPMKFALRKRQKLLKRS